MHIFKYFLNFSASFYLHYIIMVFRKVANHFNLHGDINAAHTCVLEVSLLLCNIRKLEGMYNKVESSNRRFRNSTNIL